MAILHLAGDRPGPETGCGFAASRIAPEIEGKVLDALRDAMSGSGALKVTIRAGLEKVVLEGPTRP